MCSVPIRRNHHSSLRMSYRSTTRHPMQKTTSKGRHHITSTTHPSSTTQHHGSNKDSRIQGAASKRPNKDETQNSHEYWVHLQGMRSRRKWSQKAEKVVIRQAQSNILPTRKLIHISLNQESWHIGTSRGQSPSPLECTLRKHRINMNHAIEREQLPLP